MISIESVCDNFKLMSDNVKKNVLLYDDPAFVEFKNRFLLEATITYIKISEQFSGSLFD